MAKPVCYMGIYNEHDIRDMHTVVMRYSNQFHPAPDRIVALYDHPAAERPDHRAVLELALKALEAVRYRSLRDEPVDGAIESLRNALENTNAR